MMSMIYLLMSDVLGYIPLMHSPYMILCMMNSVAMEGMESPLHALNISDSTMGMGDQDVVHDHAVANHSLMESRLLYRTGSLRVRCYQVNRCIEKTQTLISLYKKCTKLGLSNHDMETRRSELKPEVSWSPKYMCMFFMCITMSCASHD